MPGVFGWLSKPRNFNTSKKDKGRAQQTKAHRRKKTRR